jgi:hypothetical protein
MVTPRARSQSPARLVGKLSPLIGASQACPLRDIDPFAHPGRRSRTARIDGLASRTGVDMSSDHLAAALIVAVVIGVLTRPGRVCPEYFRRTLLSLVRADERRRFG